MTNSFPRKPIAPMADRVARALAQEARIETRLGNHEAAKACSDAFVAVVMVSTVRIPYLPSFIPAPHTLAMHAVSFVTSALTLGALLFRGLAL